MLAELERAFVAVCFDPQPAEQDLALLGSHERERWLVYRDMVRVRLLEMIAAGLPRTRALVGADAFCRWVDAFLATEAPRSRYIRDVVLEFATWSEAYRQLGSLPAPSIDLCAYEAACWHAKDAEVPSEPALLGFDFERIPVFSPTVRLVRTEHAVHRPPDQERGYLPGPHNLLVYREPRAKKAEHWVLNDEAAELVSVWRSHACSVSQGVRMVADRRELRVDDTFLQGLCTLLADFIDRGVVLGTREV